MYDKILERLNLKFEDLTREERTTLQGWVDVLQKRAISIEDVRNYVASMRESVENELTKSDLGSKNDLFLKARLRNYLLLEAYLSTPEKAKQALDRMIEGLVPKK